MKSYEESVQCKATKALEGRQRHLEKKSTEEGGRLMKVFAYDCLPNIKTVHTIWALKKQRKNKNLKEYFNPHLKKGLSAVPANYFLNLPNPIFLMPVQRADDGYKFKIHFRISL